jgi:hypothetical protein
MPCVITAADRASFQRCRRQWDFGAQARQDLEPLRPPAVPDLDLALLAGADARPILASGYRKRPSDGLQEGRLGGGAWSTGRGAAPPKFRGRQR